MTTKHRIALAALTVAHFLPGPDLVATESAVPVEVATARLGEVLETIELTGSVTAEQRSALSSRTAGLVAAVTVDAGSRVRTGDVLVRLDSEMATLSLAKAKAEVNQARTRRAELKRLFEEGQVLVKTGGIPTSDAKARESVLRVQESELLRLDLAAKEEAEILDRHNLVAPFDGVISHKRTEAGEWVETGDPVLELVGTERVRFDVQAPQELFSSLPANTEVKIALESRTRSEYPAKISVKVPFKDPVTRTFLVRLDVDAPEGKLVPGMSGTARFFLKSETPSVTVPRDAIVRQPDGSTAAWVVGESDGILTADMRRVVIGSRMDSTVEVRSGLADGEIVVVKGNESLRDGQEVRIVEKKLADD